MKVSTWGRAFIGEREEFALSAAERDELEELVIADGNRAGRQIVVYGAIVGSVFLATLLVGRYVLAIDRWAFDLRPMGVWAAMLWLLVIWAAQVPAVARQLIWTLPVLSTPLAFIVLMNSSQGPDDVATAAFSTALVCMLLFVATLGNRPEVVIAQAIAGVLVVAASFKRAGLPPSSLTLDVVVIALVTVASLALLRKKIRLTQDFHSSQLQRSHLGRYFSPAVVESIGGHVEPAERDITVVVVDIRGFTTLSESMSGADVVALLNEVFERLVSVLFRLDGTLDKFLGDGLLAYFGAPGAQPDHADRATECALAMQDQVRELNAVRARFGEPEIRIGIGVHSGSAVVGDIGSPSRREFTIIGDTVNVASRVEGLTKDLGHPILLSDATVSLLRRPADIELVGETAVRGRTSSLVLYAPTSDDRLPDALMND